MSDKNKSFTRNKQANSKLDTLAIVTPTLKNKGSQDTKISIESYKKRQLAKAISMGQLFPLIDLNSSLKKSYFNTFYCNHVIEQIGTELKTNYCNARWCTVCNRIRMAKMINSYGPTLLGLKDIHFVTLTAPNVGSGELRSEISKMLSSWVKIRKSISKYHKEIKLQGMRKLECTFSPKTGFNPHFHLIVSGERTGQLIIEKWLKHFPLASIKGQDCRKANDGSLIELFKYTAKGVIKGKYYPSQLDSIYHALYYRKTYYPLGIKKIVEEDIDGIESQEVDFLEDGNKTFTWNNDNKEWFDKDGISLTNHAIDGNLFDWIEKLTEELSVTENSESLTIIESEYSLSNSTESKIDYENLF